MEPRPLQRSDLDALLTSVEGSWSLPSTFSATGVHEGYSRVVVAHGGEIVLPQFTDTLQQFAPVRESWLSRIDPGGFIVPHIDAGPHYERWQIPFTDAGTLSHGAKSVLHRVGVPFRVMHDRWHSVSNTSSKPRISLVIDRDLIVSKAATPLQIGE